jgi:hypothetical protein
VVVTSYPLRAILHNSNTMAISPSGQQSSLVFNSTSSHATPSRARSLQTSLQNGL